MCLSQLEEPNILLKQWLAVCLGKLWSKYDAARWCGVRDSAHEKLQALLWHDVPDVSLIVPYFLLLIFFPIKVRAAAVYALGSYVLNVPEDGSHSEMAIGIDHNITVRLLGLLTDGSPIVRQVSSPSFPHLVHYV